MLYPCYTHLHPCYTHATTPYTTPIYIHAPTTFIPTLFSPLYTFYPNSITPMTLTLLTLSPLHPYPHPLPSYPYIDNPTPYIPIHHKPTPSLLPLSFYAINPIQSTPL